MGKREEVESYERAARALKAKEITADQFLRATRERWRRTARYIHERWRRKLPAWVEPEDVEQELVLLVLLAIRRYNRRRAGRMTLGQYATWGAIHRTQRQIHRWREASLSGNEGRNPSRCEIAFCRAFGPETDPFAKAPPAEARQCEAVEASERFEVLLAGCETVREALSLSALRRAAGDPRAAARLLFSDYATRVECELGSEAQARRVVVESLEAIAAREASAAAPELPGDLIGEADGRAWTGDVTTDGPASETRLLTDRAERAA